MKDCEKLSARAFIIFKKMESYFPPEANRAVNWQMVGRIFYGHWFDMRKSEDREKLQVRLRDALGMEMFFSAKSFKDDNGSLSAFAPVAYSERVQKLVETMLLVEELGVQISSDKNDD